MGLGLRHTEPAAEPRTQARTWGCPCAVGAVCGTLPSRDTAHMTLCLAMTMSPNVNFVLAFSARRVTRAHLAGRAMLPPPH